MDALVISSKACVLSNNVRTHYIVIKINFVYTALIAHVSTWGAAMMIENVYYTMRYTHSGHMYI